MNLNNMILIDIETGGFYVESGIYEVALMVIENNQPVDKYHFGIVEDESKIHLGMGEGYEICSCNEEFIRQFRSILDKYRYPLVAHNGSFDRRFLIYHNWLDENYEFYDSIRAIKYTNNKLFSYSMSHLIDFLDLEIEQTHTAMDDVELLWEILKLTKPNTWIPIGESTKSKSHHHNSHYLDAMKKDFEIIKDTFQGKTIVFTGKGKYVRNDLMQLAKKCGAIAENTVTKRTDILVVGEGAGSKLQKAKDNGVKIIYMDDFYEMIKDVPLDNVNCTCSQISIPRENITAKKSNKLQGEVISLFPMKVKVAEKVGKIVEAHGGIALNRLRQRETTILVYQDCEEDMVTIQKAKKHNIKTMTLGKFNKLILDIEKEEK